MTLKEKIIRVSYKAGACHIGSALSCSDIIEHIHKIKKKKDVFVFGKASGVAAYYCYKYSLKKATELLKKYPLPSKEAGCIWSGGSIGQAVSVGCGLAIADRTKDVYVLIGDGDMQEGQTYEALLFKSHHKLDNLKVYVDMNKLQACGAVKDILCTPDWFFEKLGVNLIETTKGRGVPFIEKMGYKNHYYNLDETGYAQALRELADKKGQKR